MSIASPNQSGPAEGAHQRVIQSTIGYFAAFISLGLVSASLGPTLPTLAENTNSLLSQISILFTARSLGYLLGSFVSGQVYDRVSGHPVMVGLLLLLSISLALVPLIPTLWLLALLLLLIGFSEGMVDVGGNTLLVWVHRGKVGPFMNGLHFFFGVGAFLAPLIIAQTMLATGTIRWPYWIVALLMLPGTIWLARAKSPERQLVPETEQGNTANALLVFLSALFLFMYVGAEISFGGWIYTYALKLGVATETAAAYLTSGFWGALTAGRLLAIPIAARVRPSRMLLADLLGCIVSVGLILLFPTSSAAVWIGTLGLGFSMASVFPTTLSFAERRMTITGKITSFFFIGASTGGMLLPWLIGQLFERIGPQVTMIAIFTNLMLALVVFVYLMRFSRRQQPLP